MGIGSRALDTLFLVGAGIYEDGWDPVIVAINDVAPAAGVQSAEEANFFFAEHVYHWHLLTIPNPRETDAERRRWQLKLRRDDQRLKRAIARRLRARVPTVRSGFRNIGLEAALQGTQFLITTNWDLALENAGFPQSSMLHIHGSVLDARTLLLPSEAASAHYRRVRERETMGRFVGSTWQMIGSAKQLVLFGLGISPLDAELGRTIGAGLSEHVGKGRFPVHIYDLDDRIPVIERRLHLLEPSAELEVIPHPQTR
jgi:hypothetical protein